MIPGTTVRPLRLMTRTPGPWACAPLPTAVKRPSLTVTDDTMLFPASIVWIRPLTKTSVPDVSSMLLATAGLAVVVIAA